MAECQNDKLMKEEEGKTDSPRLKGKGISGYPLKVLLSLRVTELF